MVKLYLTGSKYLTERFLKLGTQRLDETTDRAQLRRSELE